MQQIVDNKKDKNVILKLVIVLLLWIWAFWSEISYFALKAVQTSEMAHAVVAPVAIILLMYAKRKSFVQNATNGSFGAIPVLIVALGIYSVAIWPLSYGYARDIAVVFVFSAVIGTVFGWAAWRQWIPVFFILLLCIPIGMRLYASLVVLPETYTIKMTASIIDLFPGVQTTLFGSDIFFHKGSESGAIGLGETNRGARLFLTYAFVGIVTLFSRDRTVLRYVTVAVLAVPVLLICNVCRYVLIGLVLVVYKADPASMLPRNVSAVVSVLIAYLLFRILSDCRVNLFVEENQEKTVAKGEHENR